MKNFISEGKVLELTAPGGGVVSGNGYQIGQLFVVATHDAAAGEKFNGLCEGVVELPKTSAQAWAEGALIYWDSTPGEATTVTTGALLIGVAAAAAVNPSSTGRVRLNGSAKIQEV